LLTAEKFAEAEPVLRECLSIREKRDADAWTTFNTQSLLGGALLGQKKFDAAEPLLLAGYAGMKKRAKAMLAPYRIRLREAADRLVALYPATNQPDELKKWQEERTKSPEAKRPTPAEKP